MKSIDRHIKEMRGYVEDIKMFYRHEILSELVPYTKVDVRQKISKKIDEMVDDIVKHAIYRLREVEKEYGLFSYDD